MVFIIQYFSLVYNGAFGTPFLYFLEKNHQIFSLHLFKFTYFHDL